MQRDSLPDQPDDLRQHYRRRLSQRSCICRLALDQVAPSKRAVTPLAEVRVWLQIKQRVPQGQPRSRS